MPNRTVYIRKDDLEKWEAIEDRPEWLHDNIQTHSMQKSYNEIIISPPKCEKCGDYHFTADPNYKGCL